MLKTVGVFGNTERLYSHDSLLFLEEESLNTMAKLRVLGAGAKYDLCSHDTLLLSGVGRRWRGELPGVYPAALPGGGFKNILKVLFTNVCLHDCRYCFSSSSLCRIKTGFTPEELADLFTKLYREGIVEGLFLSSSVCGDSTGTMERMLEAAEIIRRKHNFNGYIHLKVLPGASRDAVKWASELADRLSINMEAPSRSRFQELTSTKNYKSDILQRMKWISEQKSEGRLPSGHTTQFVVGASDETDREILRTVSSLYRYLNLDRAYYSAFEPLKGTPLEKHPPTPLLRQYRLYQADWLLRFYGFKFGDLVFDDSGYLPLRRDPKTEYALNNPDFYPVDVNEGTYQELLRVPGIGPTSASRIVRVRQTQGKITSLRQLQKLGVVVKRARPFISVSSKTQAPLDRYRSHPRTL